MPRAPLSLPLLDAAATTAEKKPHTQGAKEKQQRSFHSRAYHPLSGNGSVLKTDGMYTGSYLPGEWLGERGRGCWKRKGKFEGHANISSASHLSLSSTFPLCQEFLA